MRYIVGNLTSYQFARDTVDVEFDIKQRHPFLSFYLSAAAFSVVIVLAGHMHSFWQEVARMLALLIGAFALWSFYKQPLGLSGSCHPRKTTFRLTDERQRQTNEQALRFGFVATLVFSLLVGLVRGFGSPIVSCGAILAVMLIAWSVGLILHSWRYR